jgi:hypothetical protein
VTSVWVASSNGNVGDLVVDLSERKALAELQRATHELLPDPEGELR